ncbi:MAG: hypothetical protein JW765_00190, partial [Deltaproteobacteria bacterium]|nr:hypothetical protein [Candidatus Zymogenaceae bacterium]
MKNKLYLTITAFVVIFVALVFFSIFPAVAAENATITGDNVRVRSNASLSFGYISGELMKGARVEVRSETSFLDTIDGFTAPWYEIIFEGRYGYYVFGRYVTVDPGATVNVDYPDENADWSNRVARYVRDNLVSLGATQSEIVRRLGKPISSENIIGVEAGETVTNRRITYDGISFEVYGPGPQDGYPYRLTCTSGAYDFGGLKVGSSMTDVKRLLGEPER